jgi:alpha-galactosidase
MYKSKKLFVLIVPLIICYSATSQSSVEIYKDSVVLTNVLLKRTLTINEEGIQTTCFINKNTGADYSVQGSDEFRVSINNYEITGRTLFRYFSLENISDLPENNGCKSIEIRCKGKDDGWAKGILILLEYRICSDLPVTRKFISIINNSAAPVTLYDLDVENLNLIPASQYLTNVYCNYGTNLMRIPYQGDYYDPALLVYNEDAKEGFILGNEAAAVLKKTNIYPTGEKITIGMKYLNEPYPFKFSLEPGNSFKSPGAFICLYNGPKWQDAFEGNFSRFVKDYLDIRLFERPSYPLFYYCTWNPFRRDINHKVIGELADALEGTGVDVLIIDDGWQDLYGDWNSDPAKFPEGIEKTCKYIRSKGLKPGLWFSMATVERESKVFRDHPEWAVTSKDGRPANLHSMNWGNWVTMSMGSPWFDYILEKISYYIRSCQLGYVKVDLTVSQSAYVMDPDMSGDYSFNGKSYKDHESSYYALMESTIRFLDILHDRFPDVIIDCTFEVWGRYNISDYALIQHSDVSWLTNYESAPPAGPISIRQVVDERARVIPPATMLVGNQLMLSDNYQFAYHSVASSVQLLCGDVRNITPEQKAWYKKWSDWFRDMENKYQYTRFYQKSDAADKATLSNWDACYKFNPEKGGGVLFFYRNNSPNESMRFIIHCVNPDKKYRIYNPEIQKEVGIFTGRELTESGLLINIGKINSALVMGIETVD